MGGCAVPKMESSAGAPAELSEFCPAAWPPGLEGCAVGESPAWLENGGDLPRDLAQQRGDQEGAGRDDASGHCEEGESLEGEAGVVRSFHSAVRFGIAWRLS